MINFIKTSFGIAGVIALVILLFCFVPMLALWALNTLAELGGSDFYIDHSLFSYFVIFIAVALLHGGGSSSNT